MSKSAKVPFMAGLPKDVCVIFVTVIPAKAGIHFDFYLKANGLPFAGMTVPVYRTAGMPILAFRQSPHAGISSPAYE
jgi:hypothetical protein